MSYNTPFILHKGAVYGIQYLQCLTKAGNYPN
jgi:hypothetical protein